MLAGETDPEAEAAELRRRATFGFRTVYLLVLGAALLGVLWGLSSPSPPFLLTMACGLVVLAAGGVWIVALGAIGLRWLRERVAHSRPGWLLVAPVLVVATVGLLWSEVPLRARFALSRGALEDVVHGEDRTGRVGLYEVEEVWRADGAVLIEVEGGFLASGGFAHLPDGPEAARDGVASRTFEHLDGDWYTYSEGFD